jgi:hypothetical protein
MLLDKMDKLQGLPILAVALAEILLEWEALVREVQVVLTD